MTDLTGPAGPLAGLEADTTAAAQVVTTAAGALAELTAAINEAHGAWAAAVHQAHLVYLGRLFRVHHHGAALPADGGNGSTL